MLIVCEFTLASACSPNIHDDGGSHPVHRRLIKYASYPLLVTPCWSLGLLAAPYSPSRIESRS